MAENKSSKELEAGKLVANCDDLPETIDIQPLIRIIRGQHVMLDRDLAVLYRVETRVLNQAVKRNLERFPEDFMFQLTKEEFEIWKSQFVISKSILMGARNRQNSRMTNMADWLRTWTLQYIAFEKKVSRSYIFDLNRMNLRTTYNHSHMPNRRMNEGWSKVDWARMWLLFQYRHRFIVML